MVVLPALGRSDYARWTDPSNLEAWWESRTQRLASLVPTGTRVIEFGAGAAAARGLPGSELHLHGVGLRRAWTGHLRVRPEPPTAAGPRPLAPEVAVFAGVLEYVRDVPSVIAWLVGPRDVLRDVLRGGASIEDRAGSRPALGGRTTAT